MSKFVLTDTSYWIGLVDPRDQHHSTSVAVRELISNQKIVLPWPCLYETLNTRLTRRRDQFLLFENEISKSGIQLLEDSDYKNTAINKIFELNRIVGHTYSLADAVIREILEDINVNIQYLVTYNTEDFEDICNMRGIEIIS